MGHIDDPIKRMVFVPLFDQITEDQPGSLSIGGRLALP
jgi:hypothetical protein